MRRLTILLASLLLALSGARGEGDPRRANAFLQKGIKALQAGEVAKAQKLFEDAQRVDPNLPQPEILLGKIAMSQSRFVDAEAHFAHAIELQLRLSDYLEKQRGLIDSELELDSAVRGVDPRSQAKSGIAAGSAELQHDAETTRLGEQVKAAKREQWEDRNEVPADYYMFLGNARMRLGHPADAVEPYRQAALQAPDFPEPHYNLAVALVQAGRLEEALAPCLRAEEMGYGPSEKLLEHIRSHLPADAAPDGP